MDYRSLKHKELSDQLTSWWHIQTDFKTKKALADFLKMHPDTLGDYFSGKKFPKLDMGNRLYDLTKIACLKPNTGADYLSEKVPQEPSSVSPVMAPPGVAASLEKLQEPDTTSLTDSSADNGHSAKIAEVIAGQQPKEFLKKEERYEARSVVISLQNTRCPFCAHNIDKFRNCGYCGQHFVWANVPLEHDELL